MLLRLLSYCYICLLCSVVSGLTCLEAAAQNYHQKTVTPTPVALPKDAANNSQSRFYALMYPIVEKSVIYRQTIVSGTTTYDQVIVAPVANPSLQPCFTRCSQAAKLYVWLHMGGDLRTYEQGNNSRACTVTVQIEGTVNCGTPTWIPLGSAFTMNVTTDPSTKNPETAYMIDMNELYAHSCYSGAADYNCFRANITGATATSVTPSPFRLELLFYEEPRVEAANNIGFDITGQVVGATNWTCSTTSVSAPVLVSTNPVVFAWDYTPSCLNETPNYQFQLLRLYNVNPSATDEEDILTKLDWNQALTLETGSPNKELTLTLTEGKGFYAWRVRPIGNRYAGGITDPANWGEWTPYTPSTASGSTTAINKCALCATTPDAPGVFFYDPQFDDDKNWSHNRVFTESDNDGPRISEGITYSNGLLQPVQSQMSLYSENKLLINQTLYDHSGRPSLQTLTSPDDSPAFEYRDLFLRTTGGALYTKQDFDVGSSIAAPQPAGTAANVGAYYSDNNTAEPEVPSANGYPFGRTLFYPDGRVRKVSGVGYDHRLTGSPSTEKATSIFYADVQEQEIVDIFGKDAPNPKSCYKVITKSPDNVFSAAYYTTEGNLIATCLLDGGDLTVTEDKITDGTSALLNPRGETPLVSTLHVDLGFDKLPVSRVADNTLISSVKLTLTQPTSITWDLVEGNWYSFLGKGKQTASDCLNLCYSCDYSVDIQIIDLESGNTVFSTSLPAVSSQATTEVECSATPTATPNLALSSSSPASLNPLGPGSYRIQRIIRLNNQVQTADGKYPPAAGSPAASAMEHHVQRMKDKFKPIEDVILDILGPEDGPAGMPPPSDDSRYATYRAKLATSPEYNISDVEGESCSITIPDVECPNTDNACDTKNFELYLLEKLGLERGVYDVSDLTKWKDYCLDDNGVIHSSYRLLDFLVDVNGNRKFSLPLSGIAISCAKCPPGTTAIDIDKDTGWGLLNAMIARMLCEENGACSTKVDYSCANLYASWVKTVNTLVYYLQRNQIHGDKLPDGTIHKVAATTLIQASTLLSKDVTKPVTKPLQPPYFDLIETFLQHAGHSYTQIIDLDVPNDICSVLLEAYKTVYVHSTITKHADCIACNKPVSCLTCSTTAATLAYLNTSYHSSNPCDPKAELLAIYHCLPENITTREQIINSDAVKENGSMADKIAGICEYTGGSVSAYVACIKKNVTDVENQCVSACERKRPLFERMILDYYHTRFTSIWYLEGEKRPNGTTADIDDEDVIPKSKFYCQVENMMRSCVEGCTLDFNESALTTAIGSLLPGDICKKPAAALNLFDQDQLDAVTARIAGAPEIRIQDMDHKLFRCFDSDPIPEHDRISCNYPETESGPPPSPPFEEVCGANGAQIIDILIERLNERFRQIYETGFTTGDIAGTASYFYLTDIADDIREIIAELSTLYSLTITVPACFAEGQHVYVNIANKNYIYPFDKAWKFSRHSTYVRSYFAEDGCNACNLFLTTVVPGVQQIQTFETYLNTYLDDVWGKQLPGLTPTDVVSASYPVDSTHTTIVRHGVMPAVAYDSLENCTNRFLDSATYFGLFGRTDSTSAFFRVPDSVSVPLTSLKGYVATKITDVFSLKGTDDPTDSLWRAFGTIIVQLPKRTSTDRPVFLKVALTRDETDSTVLLSIKLLKADLQSPDDDASEIVVPLALTDFFTKKFTDVVGKFGIENGKLVFDRIWESTDHSWDTYIGPNYTLKKYANYTDGVPPRRGIEYGICDLSALCAPIECGICVRWKPLTETILTNSDIETPKNFSCKKRIIEIVRRKLIELYNNKVQSAVAAVRASYNTNCVLNALTVESGKPAETFGITYGQKSYHFTLYYYDRAGNLMRTIPPKGFDASAPKSRSVTPAHAMPSDYTYDIVGNMVESTTPDGGTTKFWYNDKGQTRFTQDNRQAALSTPLYSYIKYDDLERTIETGEFDPGGALTEANLNNSAGYPSGTRMDVTEIFYTTPYSAATDEQHNLRNRVSYTQHSSTIGGTTTLSSITYYSYDNHGNVEWAVQKIPALVQGSDIGECRFDYDYDLVSGKVNKVSYRKGFNDQFFHHYIYDKDNRLKFVETSRDDIIWERDAAYSYYPHGPLRRVVIGEDSVQGMDYVYTIQGWLKAINHPSLSSADDPGNDGSNGSSSTPIQTTVPYDAFGSMLHYYNNGTGGAATGGDFYRSGSPFNANTSASLTPAYGLFGGGITAWSYQTIDPGGTTLKYAAQPTGEAYRYDKLGRLRGSDFRYNNGSWQTSDRYSSYYTYDPNGNIDQLSRRYDDGSAAVIIDSLTFAYPSANNRLQRVDDDGVAITGLTDLRDATASGDRYDYDDAGNLVRDDEENHDITWNHTGLVTQVQDGSDVTTFTYDAGGSRILKETSTDPQEIIVHDPLSGTPAARYAHAASEPPVLKELVIYGAGRLGILTPAVNTDRAAFDATVANPLLSITKGERLLDQKVYELTDHLGNVRAVVTDRKLPSGGSFIATPTSVASYYPFGMEQPGRVWQAGSYRYGYNGMERDDNLKGQGNSYTTPFRMNDPRLAGRWWSTDPVTKPWESPYAGYGNNPVSFIDPMGLNEAPDNPSVGDTYTDDNGNTNRYVWSTNGYRWQQEITCVDDRPPFLQQAVDFIGGVGLGAIGLVGDAIAAPFDFLMNYREPEYQQRMNAKVEGLITLGKAVGGDPLAIANLNAGIYQAAKNWWAAPAFEKGIPVGNFAASLAIPYGISKFAAAGEVALGAGSVASEMKIPSMFGEGIAPAAEGLSATAAEGLSATAAEGIAPAAIEIPYEPIKLTTSSTSTAPSRSYTIFDSNDNLYKFGVTDANLDRFKESLKLAGPGSTGKYSSIMPKSKAHIMEKYLRSLHYASTGNYELPGMKVPHPVNLYTGKKIKP